MLVILFLNAILIPYNIAFLSNESNSLENQDSFRWFFAFSDVWFILDILLTFRTGIFWRILNLLIFTSKRSKMIWVGNHRYQKIFFCLVPGPHWYLQFSIWPVPRTHRYPNSEIFSVPGTQGLPTSSGTPVSMGIFISALYNLRKFLGIMNDMSDQTVIFEPNEIRGLYVRGWFFVDLISSVPWDEILHLFMNNANLNITYLKLLRIVKILKLLRLTRMAKVMRHWEDVLDFQVYFRNLK